jgi:hypothetical protein
MDNEGEGETRANQVVLRLIFSDSGEESTKQKLNTLPEIVQEIMDWSYIIYKCSYEETMLVFNTLEEDDLSNHDLQNDLIGPEIIQEALIKTLQIC